MSLECSPLDSRERSNRGGPGALLVLASAAMKDDRFLLPLDDISLTPNEIVKTVGAGFAMGSADVVPGVSGGTMAVACGVYERLLVAISSINNKSIASLLRGDFKLLVQIVHFRFLACLFAGILSAVVVMVKIVGLPKLLISQPTYVYAVFFGLVLASIFLLGKTIPWGGKQIGTFVAGALFGWLIVTLVPMDMPGSPLYMFFYGTVAICAMLLPGISGSFILLMLGQYERVIGAIESLIHLEFSALAIVVPFGVGCLVGIGAFSRVLAWLLAHYHAPVVASLCGLLLGSLWRIWPYQHTTVELVRGKEKVVAATPYFPGEFSIAVLGLMALGLVAVFGIEALANARKSSEAAPGAS